MRVVMWCRQVTAAALLLVIFSVAIGVSGLPAETDKMFEVLNNNMYSRKAGHSVITYTDNGVLMNHVDDLTIGSTLHHAREYEILYITAVLNTVPLQYSKDDIFVDIGANIGTWTVPLASALQPYGGKVYAFEPIMDTFYYLGANIALNGLQNVEAFNLALGDKPGSKLLPKNNYTSNTNVGGFSISIFEQLFGGDRVNAATEVEGVTNEATDVLFHDLDQFRNVTVDTVDALMERGVIPACPAFVKIDVELYEAYVLKGALKTLRRCKPVLFLELDCEFHASAIVPQLMQIGYDLAYMPYATVRPNNPWVEKLFSYNKFSDDHILTMVFGAAYVMAVRREHSEVVFSNPSVNFFRISLDKGVLVRDYGIERCMPRNGVPDSLCRVLVQLPNVNNSCNLCSFHDIAAPGFWEE